MFQQAQPLLDGEAVGTWRDHRPADPRSASPTLGAKTGGGVGTAGICGCRDNTGYALPAKVAFARTGAGARAVSAAKRLRARDIFREDTGYEESF